MPTNARNQLPLVPASLFGTVLGIAGLANVWRAARTTWNLPAVVGESLFALAAMVWILVGTLYALKWVVAADAARAEAGHPVQCCFIGLGGVATLLIAQGTLPYSRAGAVLLLALGAAFTIGFGLWRTGLLWRGGRAAESTTPVLFLPTVAGGFVTATTAAALGWADWGQFAFGAALFAWLSIESVLLHRLYTAEAMPPPLRPTLGIQIAPPAVGAVSYLAVGGGAPDLVVHALLGYAILQAMVLARMGRWIAEQPFAPSYWAFTFGITALAAALVKLAGAEQGRAVQTLSVVAFLVANLLVLLVVVGSVGLLLRGRPSARLRSLLAACGGSIRPERSQSTKRPTYDRELRRQDGGPT